jgi:hypothetical protein
MMFKKRRPDPDKTYIHLQNALLQSNGSYWFQDMVNSCKFQAETVEEKAIYSIHLHLEALHTVEYV